MDTNEEKVYLTSNVATQIEYRVLYTNSLSYPSFQALPILSEFIGATGDNSLIEAMAAGKLVSYECLSHKRIFITTYLNAIYQETKNPDVRLLAELLIKKTDERSKVVYDSQKINTLLQNKTAVTELKKINRTLIANSNYLNKFETLLDEEVFDQPRKAIRKEQAQKILADTLEQIQNIKKNISTLKSEEQRFEVLTQIFKLTQNKQLTAICEPSNDLIEPLLIDFNYSVMFEKDYFREMKITAEEDNPIQITNNNNPNLSTKNQSRKIIEDEIEDDLFSRNFLKKIESDFKFAAHHIIEIMTLLQKKLEKNARYQALIDELQTLHTSLDEFNQSFFCGLKPTAFQKWTDKFNKIHGTLQAEANNHRGWHSVHSAIRILLGVLALITVIPALIVKYKSPCGFSLTFFEKPQTNTSPKIKELISSLNAYKDRLEGELTSYKVTKSSFTILA